jgi:hypothetical protein
MFPLLSNECLTLDATCLVVVCCSFPAAILAENLVQVGRFLRSGLKHSLLFLTLQLLGVVGELVSPSHPQVATLDSCFRKKCLPCLKDGALPGPCFVCTRQPRCTVTGLACHCQYLDCCMCSMFELPTAKMTTGLLEAARF